MHVCDMLEAPCIVTGGIRLSATGRAGGKAAVPGGDDGVCLTTLRDRYGPVKGGVRRQAPSRQRVLPKDAWRRGRCRGRGVEQIPSLRSE